MNALSRLASVPDFDKSPFIAFWEVTKACDLACRHCRACAVPDRDPRELTTEEGQRLLRDFANMGCPVVVVTGGDPAKRQDLVELIRYGGSLGLQMALAPSATPLLTPSLMQELADAGLQRLAISLDGAQPMTHDRFRGYAGVFDNCLRILNEAKEIGLQTQVNTTLSPYNVDEMFELASLIGAFGVSLWSVFFLVPTGRGQGEVNFSRQDMEATLHQLAQIKEQAHYDVKTTEAPHFRRVLLQRKHKRKDIIGAGGIGRAPKGVNDGQGIMFVSHTGEVSPSGFLPIVCGNVRVGSVRSIYQNHPVFRTLRDPAALHGKCGRCEFNKVCGGSRARAYAVTGDMLAEEPTCAYQPRTMAN
jgi:radical SAM protein